jgi:hypothetical protein
MIPLDFTLNERPYRIEVPPTGPCSISFATGSP